MNSSPSKAGEPTTQLSAAELVRLGYRRTSNAYRLVSRVDRADWADVLAKALHRAPADFYLPDGKPSGSWTDYYRRVHSNDTRTVSAEVLKDIPTSSHDPVAYIEGTTP